MDPDAPLNVTKGVAVTCLVNSLIFSAYGTFKRLPIGPLAASAAVNGGIVGATFFSFREYVVSPQLLLGVPSGQFARRKAELDAVKAETVYTAEKLDWWEMRGYMLPDTAISGALTGGVLNSWKRGVKGIMPGAVTASLLCTFLQVAYNELGIMRLKFISDQLKKAQAQQDEADNILTPATKLSETATSALEASITVVHPAPSQPMSERIFGWLGFQRVSDEDYLERLKAERDGHLRRIAELEKEKEDTKS